MPEPLGRQVVLGAVRLYLPLSLVVGALVALPTLLTDNPAGRLAGVAGASLLLAVMVRLLVRRAARRSVPFTTRPLMTGQVTGTEVVHDARADPARLMRRMHRVQRMSALWPVFVVGGLVVGGSLGALSGSYLVTVAGVAGGLLVGMATTAVPALLVFRSMSR